MLGRLAASARHRVADHISARLNRQRDRIAARFTLPDKYKGGTVEKWALYWRQLARDYGEVFVSIVRFGRTHPVRSALYGAAGAGVYQCVERNPTEVDYVRELRQRTGDVVQVAESCQRRETREYLRTIEQRLNRGELRHQSLGVASLLWHDDYDAGLALFKATCGYTRPPWRTWHERIVDVGFCGRWWMLREKLKDYDVAEE